jgi:hypothetical protein
MRPITQRQSALRAPLNGLFGTEANVRLLRVLSGTNEPISPSRLAEQAMLALSGIARAISALEEQGIVEYVGAGVRRPVRLRTDHPLASAISTIFRAEHTRFDAIVGELTRAAQRVAPLPRSVWIEGPVVQGEDRLGDPLIIGLLTNARELDHATSSLESLLEQLERNQDVSVEVRGWTAADLLAAPERERKAFRHVLPVLGPPPLSIVDARSARVRSPARSKRKFSHAELDARARALAAAVSTRIRVDPGIVQRASAHVDARLASASAGEQGELREWQRIFRTMSMPRLRRFLVEGSERANRLRQTSPFFGVLSADERDRLIAEHGGGSHRPGRS